jgi:NAD(P)H-dependent flavin oxidoreductase YrpB (nitropropane dioxygenase family)
VLIPEVLRGIKPIRNVPVLAAGGIMTGRQMAACMALGAAGVWTGSVWLATTESETSEIFRQKMIEATSRDTVRSKCRTGKYSRQLGLVDSVKSSRAVVREFMEEFAEALNDMQALENE